MLQRRVLTSTALTLVLAAQTSAGAWAQEVKLEEITVTARKVSENLMVVPLPITALSNDALEQRGVYTNTDLSQFTPGFFQQDTTAASTGRTDRSDQTLVFRALNVANNSGLESGGSMFIDGAPVSSLTAAGFADVDHVEVLRGPQSAYFGRSTFGGAVNYITRDPNMDHFQGHVAAQVSSYGSTDDTLAFEGPLVQDKLAMRVTGYYTKRGGEWTNAANPNEKLGEQGTDSISTTLVAKPTDNLKIKAYFNYYQDNDGAPAEAAYNPSQSNCTTVSGPYFCGKIGVPAAQNISAYDVVDSYQQKYLFGNASNFPMLFNPKSYADRFGLKRTAYQSDAIVNYDTQGGYDFTSVTAYHKAQFQATDDLDYRDYENVPNPLYGITASEPFYDWTSLVQNQVHDFSQELRVTSPQSNRLRWLAGANYLSEYDNNAVIGSTDLGPLDFNPPQPTFVHTTGLFGGLYYDIMSDLTLSLEARYQWDKIIAEFGSTKLQNTFGSFTPRATVNYKLNSNSSLYALYSRGDRPGGFNSDLLQAGSSELKQVEQESGGGLSYQQETLDNFEVGFKDQFLDNHASIRADAYYGVLKNQQVTVREQVDVGLPTYNIYNVILNVGKSDIFGFEFEGDYQVDNHLKLSATFDWAGSSIRQYNCLDCVTYYSGSANVTGKKFNDVPEFSGTFSAEYTDHLSGDYNWFTRADYIYIGTIYADLNNVASTGAANKVNLRLGVRNNSLTIEGFVNNLTNNLTLTGLYYNVSTLTLTNTQMRVGLPDKRTFGIRATYNF